jgi:hypothetical protein
MTAVAAATVLEDDVLSLEASSMSEEESDDTQQGNAVTSSGSAEWHFTPSDANLLVRLVKMCQKMGYGGLRGTWKDYLKVRYCIVFSSILGLMLQQQSTCAAVVVLRDAHVMLCT